MPERQPMPDARGSDTRWEPRAPYKGCRPPSLPPERGVNDCRRCVLAAGVQNKFGGKKSLFCSSVRGPAQMVGGGRVAGPGFRLCLCCSGSHREPKCNSDRECTARSRLFCSRGIALPSRSQAPPAQPKGQLERSAGQGQPPTTASFPRGKPRPRERKGGTPGQLSVGQSPDLLLPLQAEVLQPRTCTHHGLSQEEGWKERDSSPLPRAGAKPPSVTEASRD